MSVCDGRIGIQPCSWDETEAYQHHNQRAQYNREVDAHLLPDVKGGVLEEQAVGPSPCTATMPPTETETA